MQTALVAITVAVVSVAVYTDVRWSKVLNVITLPAIVAGLSLNTASNGLDGLLASLAGVGVALLVFIFSSALGRILGGGDVKLLAAVGALNGAPFLGLVIVYTALIGAVLAIVVALSHGILGDCLRRLGSACYLRAVAQVPMQIEASQRRARLPYAIAICLGTITALVWGHLGF